MELGWIDYSDKDKNTILAMLDALKGHFAVDELGIGIARDSISDALFPATSTLFTRARYFYLAPYLAMKMERSDKVYKSSREANEAFNRAEKDLALKLLEAERDSAIGIIGSRTLHSSSGKGWVKRGPLEIYWHSLSSLGFLRNERISRSDLFRELCRKRPSPSSYSPEEIGYGCADDISARHSFWNMDGSLYAEWHEREFKTSEASIAITPDEAFDLKDRYVKKYGKTLFGRMLSDREIFGLAKKHVDASNENERGIGDAFIDFIEDLLSKDIYGLPEKLYSQCENALLFSDFILGCFIRYNCLVTDSDEIREWWSDYLELYLRAAQRLDVRELFNTFGIWSHAGCWELSAFLDKAKSLSLDGRFNELDSLIALRESRLKGARGKIKNPPQGEHGWIGQSRLFYRFNIGYSIAKEIYEAIDA